MMYCIALAALLLASPLAGMAAATQPAVPARVMIVSIDGLRSHDRWRVDHGGAPAHDRIVRGLNLVRERRRLYAGLLAVIDLNGEPAFEEYWNSHHAIVEDDNVCICRSRYDLAERLGIAEITMFRRNSCWTRADVPLGRGGYGNQPEAARRSMRDCRADSAAVAAAVSGARKGSAGTTSSRWFGAPGR